MADNVLDGETEDPTALTEKLNASAGRLTTSANGFGRAMNTAFAQAITSGKSFDDTLKTLALRLSDLGVRADAEALADHQPRTELAPAEKYLKIVSSFRSHEYQERLRKQSPNAGRAGLATNSPHFTGRALDLYVGGEPVETKDSNRALQIQTPVYQWLVRNSERFGFRPYYYEPWHWEYTGNHQ